MRPQRIRCGNARNEWPNSQRRQPTNWGAIAGEVRNTGDGRRAADVIAPLPTIFIKHRNPSDGGFSGVDLVAFQVSLVDLAKPLNSSYASQCVDCRQSVGVEIA